MHLANNDKCFSFFPLADFSLTGGTQVPYATVSHKKHFVITPHWHLQLMAVCPISTSGIDLVVYHQRNP